MKCTECGGTGKVDGWDGLTEYSCKVCNGKGYLNEQEYIQTCNTDQLAEFLFHIACMCSYCGDEAHSTEEKTQKCHFGKCCCRRQDWLEWLKRPHV